MSRGFCESVWGARGGFLFAAHDPRNIGFRGLHTVRQLSLCQVSQIMFQKFCKELLRGIGTGSGRCSGRDPLGAEDGAACPENLGGRRISGAKSWRPRSRNSGSNPSFKSSENPPMSRSTCFCIDAGPSSGPSPECAAVGVSRRTANEAWRPRLHGRSRLRAAP